MDTKNVPFCSLDSTIVGDFARRVQRTGHHGEYYIESERDRSTAF